VINTLVEFTGPTRAPPAPDRKREMTINIVNVEPEENILNVKAM
jgi:hypothetical protein